MGTQCTKAGTTLSYDLNESMTSDGTTTNFTVQSVRAIKLDNPFTVQSIDQRRRTLVIGNTLKRKRKGFPNDPPYEWTVVRDVITAHPASDSSEYVAVLCEGIGEHAHEWFVWRAYFTNNRYGRLTYGQFGPQAPIAIDKWITDQIVERGWYEKNCRPEFE